VYAAGNGVLVQNSPFFTLEHSEVAYFNHVGVSIGWVWGFAMPPATHNNTIEYNHIHHMGNGELSDLGGIYCLGVQPGTVPYALYTMHYHTPVLTYTVLTMH
jgi:hypothetical protein